MGISTSLMSFCLHNTISRSVFDNSESTLLEGEFICRDLYSAFLILCRVTQGSKS